MSRKAREAIADWLMVLGALALVVSLFFTWSHQFSPGFRATWGSLPALHGVPRDPTGWQVYSVADVCLAAVAAAIVFVAFVGTRRARLLALIPAGVALAFVVHAMNVPPTDGVNLVLPGPDLVAGPANHPLSGFGETLAVAALGAALAGLGLSFTAD